MLTRSRSFVLYLYYMYYTVTFINEVKVIYLTYIEICNYMIHI